MAFRVFVVFMGHWGGTLVAFTALVLFMGLWSRTFLVDVSCGVYCVFIVNGVLGWTLVKFTAFVAFMRCSGWSCL